MNLSSGYRILPYSFRTPIFKYVLPLLLSYRRAFSPFQHQLALNKKISASASSDLCHCCWRSPRFPHCCCCCCCCLSLCLRTLMVWLGCGQLWCVTLFAAPAATPAHLLAAGLQPALRLWPARRPLHPCFLRLSLSPFHLLLLSLLPGREGAGGGGRGQGGEPGGGRGASRRL
jgi:hypothetical protein